MDRRITAVRAARTGAALAAELFRTGLDVETKDSATDFVTEAVVERQAVKESVFRDLDEYAPEEAA